MALFLNFSRHNSTNKPNLTVKRGNDTTDVFAAILD